MRTLNAVAVLVAASAAPVAARADDAATANFDRAFATAGEPHSLRYQVLYRSGGSTHRLQIWRDGERRIRRTTDAAVDTIATREGSGAEYALVVLDATRRVSTRLDRTDLYRVGNFTDWFDLGHGLRHPKGPYRLTIGAPPPAMPRPAEACRWYDLVEGARTSHICWGLRSRVPLLIATGNGSLVWRVISLDRRPVSNDIFAVHDEGMVKSDMSDD